MSNIVNGINWGTATKVDLGKVEKLVTRFLMQEEVILLAFKVVRDVHIMTTHRLMSIDVQGITGTKKEIRTIPYGKISAFSVESAGTFDMDAELKIFVSGLDPLEIKLARETDVAEITNILAIATCTSSVLAN